MIAGWYRCSITCLLHCRSRVKLMGTKYLGWQILEITYYVVSRAWMKTDGYCMHYRKAAV